MSFRLDTNSSTEIQFVLIKIYICILVISEGGLVKCSITIGLSAHQYIVISNGAHHCHFYKNLAVPKIADMSNVYFNSITLISAKLLNSTKKNFKEHFKTRRTIFFFFHLLASGTSRSRHS